MNGSAAHHDPLSKQYSRENITFEAKIYKVFELYYLFSTNKSQNLSPSLLCWKTIMLLLIMMPRTSIKITENKQSH